VSQMLEVPDHLVTALSRMLSVSLRKRNDYSRVGPWQNFKDTSEFFGLDPWQSAIFNCIQKLSRVQSLSDGREVLNEPLEDTLLDFANYALFAYAMYLDGTKAAHRETTATLTDPSVVYVPSLNEYVRICCGSLMNAEHYQECDKTR
jgi:hypothetical protein